jgi:hypothetical protein
LRWAEPLRALGAACGSLIYQESNMEIASLARDMSEAQRSYEEWRALCGEPTEEWAERDESLSTMQLRLALAERACR